MDEAQLGFAFGGHRADQSAFASRARVAWTPARVTRVCCQRTGASARRVLESRHDE